MTREGTAEQPPKRRPVQLVGKLFDGRVRLERLSTTKNISARAFIQGKLIRKSTREATVGAATRVARDWYATLLAKQRLGESVLDIDGVDFSKPIEGGVADGMQHREQPSGAATIVRVLAANGYECSHDDARRMWVSFSRKQFERNWENISFNAVPRYSDAEIFQNLRPFFKAAD